MSLLFVGLLAVLVYVVDFACLVGLVWLALKLLE